MTIDVPTASLGVGVAVVGWFLIRLTVFDAIHRLERSAESQGKRIGDLESWTEAHDKVDEYRFKRKMTAPHGNPTSEDDTPT